MDILQVRRYEHLSRNYKYEYLDLRKKVVRTASIS